MSATTLPLPAAAGADRYRYRYIIAMTVSLASVLELLDTSIVNVAIPHMMGTLGATLDEIAWVSTGYIVANVIILPITGWLSAYFGRQRYFAGSIALFTIASFFCGNSHTLIELVIWRILRGWAAAPCCRRRRRSCTRSSRAKNTAQRWRSSASA